jgi:hypothetical protein
MVFAINCQQRNYIVDIVRAQQLFSQPRMSTYQHLAVKYSKDPMQFYLFNINISSAFCFPLHVYEILLRNIADKAICKAYCESWPFDATFRARLDIPRRVKLDECIKRNMTKDQIVSELTLSFWIYLVSQKHINLWISDFNNFFPHFPKSISVRNAINRLNRQLRQAKDLRNRIAHYEPILMKNLYAEYDNIMSIINYIDADCASWVHANQQVNINLQQLSGYMA